MGLNRDKFRKIVGGITTELAEEPVTEAAPAELTQHEQPPLTGQGTEAAVRNASVDMVKGEESPRFAKRGRPKGRKVDDPATKVRKVKVSLFLSESIIKDLYDWAHEDRIHPGEMFERALKPFHEKETKRRNGGKE
jgi:hypothetical protein